MEAADAMTSILTNTSAMSALASLTATQRELSTTQARMSSGLAVANASDNAAYWSIGMTMSAQVAGIDATQASLSLTQSIATVTATALTSIISSVQRIQSDLVAAQTSGISLQAVQSDIKAQQQSIIAVANSASFNGVNWLVGSASVNSVTSDIRHTDTDHITAQYSPTTAPGVSYNDYADYTSTTTGTNDYGSTISSTYETSGYWTTDNSGTTAHFTNTQTGSSAPGNFEYAFPTSEAGSGLQFGSVDLTKLRLFANISGSNEVISHGDYADGYSYGSNSVTSSGTYGSYQNVGSLSTHILDQALVYAGGSNPNAPLGSLLALDITNAKSSDIKAAAQGMTGILSALTGASGLVGSVQNVAATAQTFNASLSDALTSGVGSLVDADMNVASTRLQALQTQQQLGIQALSMANQNSQLILKLFQAA